ncbi:MAG TPA: Spx/MgsR family RNA polymerase-binding regulatory protein [Candidatus Merdibacter merdavium]|uniref:Spx/MgsR family RNA polymerase-binding regulatory protein n=1 Tax=Candidatus Merdibacter merdavium TaxID=2838692 RepID=A0A9D2SV04_9FIRM|nr:Spx/MgsR family RNA polymerase-binding regulatory protein [Candidatus Merdibacter merdavium]
MIILYTSPGCASCRKAKQWLKDNQLPFVEKNIFTTMLKEDEIKYLLSRCENGTEDIISVRSKAFQQLGCDIDDLSVSALVDIVRKSPSILKRPIMISEKSMVVGYDDDEITTMVPQALRNVVRDSCNQSCPNYPLCGKVRSESS